MGWLSGRSSVHDLVRREAVIHLQDGETSIKGFLLEFYPDALLVAKPVLMLPGDEESSALAGETLVFRDQIKFIQLLGRAV